MRQPRPIRHRHRHGSGHRGRQQDHRPRRSKRAGQTLVMLALAGVAIALVGALVSMIESGREGSWSGDDGSASRPSFGFGHPGSTWHD